MDRRQFLTAGAAAGAIASAPGLALAAAPLEGRATRLDLNRLRLDWTGTRGPALVLASSDADAPAFLMRPMKVGFGAKSAEFELATSPAPISLSPPAPNRCGLQSGFYPCRAAAISVILGVIAPRTGSRCAGDRSIGPGS